MIAVLEFLKSRIGQIIIAAVAAFFVGFSLKGQLDDGTEARMQLAVARANIEMLQQQALASKAVAESSAQRERETAELAADLQKKVDDYADALSKNPSGACAFDESDLERLRGIISRPVGPDASGRAR